MHLQFRSNDDNRSSGVVYTLTKEVLSKSTLLTLKLVSQGLQVSLGCTLCRILHLTIVQETVYSFLQHSLLVSDNDVWSLD